MGEQDEYELVDSDTVFQGHILSLHRDTVRMSDNSTSVREVVRHPGAVGVVALDAAKRELLEEAGLEADDWHVLLDLHTSPGFSDEAIRLYLARGLHRADKDGFQASGEELTMTVERESLSTAVRRALSGSITNAAAVAGLLAAVHGRATDWRDLRPADAPWPARPGL